MDKKSELDVKNLWMTIKKSGKKLNVRKIVLTNLKSNNRKFYFTNRSKR